MSSCWRAARPARRSSRWRSQRDFATLRTSGGRIGGGALVLGALVAWFFDVPQRLIAGVMAFGSGVLISALAFELMDEAYKRGGLDSTGLGFVGGAAIYTAANWILARQGAKHRKRSGAAQQPSESEDAGSGLAIAIGAL